MWNYFKKYSALIEYHITMLYKPCVRRHNFLYRTVNCWACWWRWYPSPITTSSTPMSHTPWCPPPSYSSWQRRSSGSSPPETCLVGRQGCYGRSEDCKGEYQKGEQSNPILRLNNCWTNLCCCFSGFEVLIQNTYQEKTTAICEWNVCYLF